MLRENVTYIITYHKGTKYCDLHSAANEVIETDTVRKLINSLETLPTLDTLITVTDTFRIHTLGGYHYLYHPASRRYVSQVDWAVADDPSQSLPDCFAFTTTPRPGGRLAIEKTKSGVELRIGSKYMCHHTTMKQYAMRRQSDKKWLPVEMYACRPVPQITLGDDQGLPTDCHFSGTVVLQRELAADCYNTLILPFDVVRPQSVFGAGAMLYEPVEGSAETITFRQLAATDTLHAHRPYLVGGQVSGGPYTFRGVRVDYTAAADRLRLALGGMTIQGSYTACQMGGTRRFALYRTSFRSCHSVASLQMAPYRWYIDGVEGGASRIRVTTCGRVRVLP